MVWTFRAVLWAVLLIIGYRGVMAIVAPPKSSAPPSGTAVTPSDGFPVSEAEAYALQFGSVYLNFSPATAQFRADELADFLPSGASAEFGWNGAGSMQLQSEQVASIAVTDSQHAVVKLLARVNGQLIELGVPVYAANGGMSVSAEPALLPPPGRVQAPAATGKSSDPAATSALDRQLPAFFRAYASGDPVTLSRFLAPGATV
ncbi:MAG: conjugal transfer protein, partial [Actinomycetota bacterium]